MEECENEVSEKISQDRMMSFCTSRLCLKLQKMASIWVKTFVIKQRPSGEWQFRTLFVAEVSVLPFLVTFLIISWWALNRNVRLKKTKGSSIPHKGDTSSYDDTDEDVSDEDLQGCASNDGAMSESLNKPLKREPTAAKRKKLQAMLKAFTVELDEDEQDDETILSVDSSLEDSDYEDDTNENSQAKKRKSDLSASQMFLSQEKLDLWKLVREIPIFSFFNVEAMEMCLNGVEFVDLRGSGDFLWKEGTFDGSFYYVVSGKVQVNFRDFKASHVTLRGRHAHNNRDGAACVLHEQGTVVTSQLALIDGMIRSYLSKMDTELGRFIGLAFHNTTAHAVEDDTRLIRIPPSCFSKIMDRYPETVLRIIQTTLNRTQRVTVQTLVRCCGLRQELLVPRKKELKQSMKANQSLEWALLKNDISEMDLDLDEGITSLPFTRNQSLMKNACSVLTRVLNIEESETIEILEEKCSLVAFNGGNDERSRVLLEAGSNHASCYFLLQGCLELGIHLPLGDSSSKELQSNPDAWYFQRIETITAGSILGESTLFTTDINLFEIRCAAPSESFSSATILLQIPKDVYGHLVVKHPKAMATLLVPVLSVLSPVVHFMMWTAEWMHLGAAEEIVQKGTPCDSLFVVLNGRLRAANRSKVRKRAFGPVFFQIPPQEYGRGKIFGQIGSLANVDWPFDVFAIRQSELAKIPIETLEVVVQNFPHAGLSLARVVASDIESLYTSNRTYFRNNPNVGLTTDRSNFSPPHSKPLPFNLPSYGLNLATIAVVPLSYNIDLKSFCKTLGKAMGDIAPSKLLTKSYVRQQLGEKVYHSRDAIHTVKMTRLLADLEENNRVIIYQADPKFTFWTRLCILQADCILLAVDSDHAPETSRVEQTLAWAYEAMDVRVELVVVGKGANSRDSYETDSDGSYFEEDDISVSDQLNNWSESKRWIAGHHLVRVPFGRHRIDFHRMCRRISGRSVGLVLGAGGARGIAHLGIIRALKEAGITVDMVGGTSQGAFCGALFAKNPDDYDEVVKACRVMAGDASSMKEKLLDLTLPMASMFAGRRFNRGIKKLLGKLRIQDLVLNFFCVSVDLQNQNTIVHTKGQLWKSVRASMGLTGYLPPVAENGSLLVDGGYLNSLPADVMKHQMGARTVIAVDVSTECKREYYEYGSHLSGWWLLWNSWNPFVKTVQVPSMGDIQDMLIWVSSEQHRKSVKMISDLYLTPPIQDVGTLEYDRFDEIVEKSYLYAKPIVDDWVQKNPWLVTSPTTIKNND